MKIPAFGIRESRESFFNAHRIIYRITVCPWWLIHTFDNPIRRFFQKREFDFAMAFWMVHEVPDRKAMLRLICASLKPGGR